MMKKRGFSLPIEVIIYTILAILVLVLILVIFRDQSNTFVEKLKDLFSLTDQNVTN